MSALPLVVKAALVAVLLGSILRVLLGRPAPRPNRGLARALLGATALLYLGGVTMLLATDAALAGGALVVAGIETSCMAAWLARARGDDDDADDDGDDGGGGTPRPHGPGPIDWAAFDLARAGWERERQRARQR